MVAAIYSLLAQYAQLILSFLAFALLVAIALFIRRIPGLYRPLRAGSWPMTQGRIETANVIGFAQQSLVQLGYSYSVEGSLFSGYLTHQFADEQDAWEYVDLVKGQMIPVRYRAGQPAISAVRTADQNTLHISKGKSFLVQLMGRTLSDFFTNSHSNGDRLKCAGDWPTIRGRVESGAVTRNGEEGLWYLASSYTSEIGYSYSVEGTYYAGHLTKTFFREESARRFVERLKGRDVIVRYSPTSSRISRLCREDQTEISFS
jgi:hypothetical protein